MSDNRPDLYLSFPWNLWYAMLGLFAWGPLEVFFITWLITNTDRIFKNRDIVVSWGLIITVIIFGLIHIVTTQNLYNAAYTGTIFLVLGLIYKYSRNAIGPMIAWTLINGQVWYIMRLIS
ncbi:MAG: CPBP family intramembrane metalloprotease [Spirochaetes bacterium]|nr:CPBP family intramembrane metalloprotease [Spirochaetota bacterium]